MSQNPKTLGRGSKPTASIGKSPKVAGTTVIDKIAADSGVVTLGKSGTQSSLSTDTDKQGEAALERLNQQAKTSLWDALAQKQDALKAAQIARQSDVSVVSDEDAVTGFVEYNCGVGGSRLEDSLYTTQHKRVADERPHCTQIKGGISL